MIEAARVNCDQKVHAMRLCFTTPSHTNKRPTCCNVSVEVDAWEETRSVRDRMGIAFTGNGTRAIGVRRGEVRKLAVCVELEPSGTQSIEQTDANMKPVGLPEAVSCVQSSVRPAFGSVYRKPTVIRYRKHSSVDLCLAG